MVTKRKPASSSGARNASTRAGGGMRGARGARPLRAGSASKRHVNAGSVEFSSARRSSRATRGYVDNVVSVPDGAVRSRQTHRELAQSARRRSLASTLAVGLVCVALAVAVAAFVGIGVFRATIDAKMGLSSDSAASALAEPAEDAEGVYTLLACDLDEQGVTKLGDGPDALALVCTNDGAARASILSIPAATSVTLSDGKTHSLREAATWSDAELIDAVSTLCDVDVSHYVSIDADGVTRLVDALGGVTLDVSEEIDDPNAGDQYIAAGEQTIGPDQITTFLRATNLSGGTESQAQNQRAFLAQVASRLVGDGTLSNLTRLNEVAGTFATDVTAKEAGTAAKAFSGLDPDAVDGAVLPGYEGTSEGSAVYHASSDDVEAMMARMAAGERMMTDEQARAADVDPASFTVTVRNGSGVTGGAAEVAEALSSLGYQVGDIGNTDTYAYTETLVVYVDDAYADAAQSVVDALGIGRVVDGTGFYTFDTNVLVVVGSDWAPLS